MRTNRPIEIYNTCEVKPGDRAYKSKGLKRSEVAQLEIGTGGGRTHPPGTECQMGDSR